MKNIDAAAVQLARDWYAEGKTQGWIAKTLSTAGYRNRTGSRLAQNNVSILLRNKKYSNAVEVNWPTTTEPEAKGETVHAYTTPQAVPEFLLNRYEVGEVLTSNLPKNIKMKLLVNIPISI